MLLQALHVGIERKNLNLQVKQLVQNVWELDPTNYTRGYGLV